jgi:hypothetical protein
VSETLGAHQARAAKNQALFRTVNENLESLNEAFDEAAAIGGEWLCECSDPNCTRLIPAQLDEYETVRLNPKTFLVYPGHVDPEVERVVDQNERFTIVEKFGEGGKVADVTNPRAHARTSD